MNIPARPEGAIDRSGIIEIVQEWPQYANERVVDCYSVKENGETILKVVTTGDRKEP